MLTAIDQARLKVSAQLDIQKKSLLGQFMTPSTVARFMASLFSPSTESTCRLLDPGAGIGSLTSAFLDRWTVGGFGFERIEVEAYEVDDTLRKHLERNLANYSSHLEIQSEIIAGDFIEHAVGECSQGQRRFTHAILNPPYKKINSKSFHRLVLRRIGIETVNLYSAFVALALALLENGGQLVTIIPRSFCNGPYYRPFREFMLERAAVRHMHLFGARNKAFKDDDVLQENIIILLECGGLQSDVTISTSTDDSFADYTTHVHPFERIVFPEDLQRFIHVPISPERNSLELSPEIRYSITDLGLEVSTGPVVDFRIREHLRDMPISGTVPLLYPGHFTGQGIEWPKLSLKKPNALERNAETEKWLYPAGCYTVVRRFSSKEEKRRIMASLVDPAAFPDVEAFGFENHLNVFHCRKRSLPEALARGLTVYLNTSAVDDNFRRFNGHTQVNATDLRQMKYPNRETLIALGEWAKTHKVLTQDLIDEKLEALTTT